MIPTVVQHLPCFKDLIAVLFECFLIITLGYLSCRFKLISTHAKDLNSYLTTFALPMIIFLNIAQMNFQTINLSFLLCMLTSKLLVFILVTLLTLAISYPTNFGYAGALSILATQSNDFALGYPLIKSLYGDTRSEMLDYLNLMAPIQLLILNPLGIVMLEYQKSRIIKTPNKDSCSYKTIQNNITDVGSHGNEESNDEIEDNDEDDDEVQQKLDDNLIKAHDCPYFHNNNHKLDCKWRQKQQILNDSFIGERVDSNHDFIGVTNNGNKFNQQIRRRMSANEKSNECLHTTNERFMTKQSTSTSILKIGNKNIKSLKLMLPGIDNIIDSDSSPSPIAKSHSSQYNHIATTSCCCYCLSNNTGVSDGSRLATDNIITTRSAGCEVNINDNQDIAIITTSTLNTFPDKLDTSSTVLNLNFLRALATNPLIIASVVALAVNLIHGPQLPKFVTKVSNTIAASFAAPALFVVGLSMFGKFELILKNPNDLLLSSVLVLTKVILLPSLMRTLASIILPAHTPTEEIPYLIDFSFLYGLLPTAPTACIIAKQYGVLTNVVSISMLLSIFLSAPLMLAASVIINPSGVIKSTDIQNIILQTLKISSIVTLILASITLFVFWKSMKRSNYNKFINLPLEIACIHVTNKIKTNPMHIFLFLLATTQIIISLGGISWYFVDKIEINSKNLTLLPNSMQLMNLNIQLKNNSSSIIEKLSKTNMNPMNISNIDIVVDTHTIPLDLLSPIPKPDVKPMYDDDGFSNSDHRTKQANQIINKAPIWLSSMSSESIDNSSFTAKQSRVSLEALSSIQYVLASYGILLVRFVVFSILITTASIKFKGYIVAKNVSIIMVKSFISISLILIIWLIYEIWQEQKGQLYFPIESIIPSKKYSLYIRLLYDFLFIIISVPLFALIIRSDNKTKRLMKEKKSSNKSINDDEDENVIVDNVCKRADNFRSRKKPITANSNVSLSSDTNSALTANTNLESSPSSNIAIDDVNNIIDNDVINFSQQNHHRRTSIQNIDSVSILIENTSTMQGNNHPTIQKKNLNSDTNTYNMTSSIEVDSNNHTNNQSIIGQQSIQRMHNQDQIFSQDNKIKFTADLVSISKFNKYSVLILFMLITTTLNFTTIIQKLVQDKPFGTFGQIEIISVVLEFGQGLLTFLLYGMRGAFN